MLRTTPPPHGICFVLKLSGLGSNLTGVLGFTPDSLYQTKPSFVIALSYGSESVPPGEASLLATFHLWDRSAPDIQVRSRCNKWYRQG